jgi:hypothetical protein
MLDLRDYWNQRSATPVSFAGSRASRRLNLETGVRKIRGRVTNENRANVAVQIKMLIPAMISMMGMTAFGPPSIIRIGHEVRTITTLRRADLRTTLRRFGVVDSSSLPEMFAGLRVDGFMGTPRRSEKDCRRFRTISKIKEEPSDRTSTTAFVTKIQGDPIVPRP